MSRLTRLLRGLGVWLAAGPVLIPAVAAQTVTNEWLGGTDLWNVPANWSAGVVPNQLTSPAGSSFRVVLGSGAPTLNEHIEVDYLDMTGATLDGNGFNLNVLQGVTFSGPDADALLNINLTFTGGIWVQGDITLAAGASVVNRGDFLLQAANTMTIEAGSSWRNEGTLTTTADRLTRIEGGFHNAGLLIVPQGGIEVTGDVVQTDGNLVLLGQSGVTTMASPAGQTSTEISVEGGNVLGNGLVEKNLRLESGCMLSPGIPGSPYGHITSRGNLTLEAGSRVVIDIGGPLFNPPGGIQYDRFQAGGSLKASGILEVRLVDGYEPASDARFLIAVSQGNMSIAFSNVAVGGRIDSSDGGGSFLLSQENRNLYLQDFIPIPEPGAVPLVLLGALLLRLCRRRA